MAIVGRRLESDGETEDYRIIDRTLNLNGGFAVKLTLRVNPELPIDERGISEYINQYSGECEVKVESVKRANYGIGADCSVALVDIRAIFELAAGVYAVFKLPYAIQQLPKQIDAWKKLNGMVRSIFVHVEGKYKVAAYPIEAIIVDATDYLMNQISEAVAIDLLFAQVKGTYHGGLLEQPATYDNSRLVYYGIVFKVSIGRSNYLHCHIWDSQKHLLAKAIIDFDQPRNEDENDFALEYKNGFIQMSTLHDRVIVGIAVDFDPRCAERKNKDIR